VLDRDRIEARIAGLVEVEGASPDQPVPAAGDTAAQQRQPDHLASRSPRSSFGRCAAGTAASKVPIHCHDVEKGRRVTASSVRHSRSRVASGGRASQLNSTSRIILARPRQGVGFGTKSLLRYIRRRGRNSTPLDPRIMRCDH
jgi:hypothetical protein